MNQPNNKPAPVTVLDKEFIDKDTGVTVYVKRTKTDKGMEYDIGVGFLINDEPHRTFRPMHLGVGKVSLQKGVGEIISNLWEQAEQYLLRTYQAQEDRRIEKEIERGKPNHKAPPPGLKKLGKMDAKKNEKKQAQP